VICKYRDVPVLVLLVKGTIPTSPAPLLIVFSLSKLGSEFCWRYSSTIRHETRHLDAELHCDSCKTSTAKSQRYGIKALNIDKRETNIGRQPWMNTPDRRNLDTRKGENEQEDLCRQIEERATPFWTVFLVVMLINLGDR
jgi:hypothetical protein